MSARAVMIAGTGSDVGKSLLVAGLARVYARRGLKVRPFKPQNMSNNAAVTIDGGEIGRAQALQARAAGVAPNVDMNPVLLKPQSEAGSQVVVQGRVLGSYKAKAYQALKPQLLDAVLQSFQRLCGEADVVLVEGAGSPAEINLRGADIANLGFARAARVPVVIVGDIDRGGVIASLVGTKHVLDESDAQMIKGFIVNKFRGDPDLFRAGMAEISRRTGWHNLGLVPHFADARRLPAEDSVALDTPVVGGAVSHARDGEAVKICVLHLPHISNFDDFDPLIAEPDVHVAFIKPGMPVPADAALVIIPGSKSVARDLQTLKQTGWDIDIKAHVRRGGQVLGICGGFQMLGHDLRDPSGIEGPIAREGGLGLLDITTALIGAKTLKPVGGHLTGDAEASFSGYEMHVGDSDGAGLQSPFLVFDDGRPEGATSTDGLVSGTYVHGLLNADGLRHALLRRLGAAGSATNFEASVEATLDALAEHLETHVDCDQLLEIACAPHAFALGS